jgi:hypothetical protein
LAYRLFHIGAVAYFTYTFVVAWFIAVVTVASFAVMMMISTVVANVHCRRITCRIDLQVTICACGTAITAIAGLNIV